MWVELIPLQINFGLLKLAVMKRLRKSQIYVYETDENEEE